MNRRDFMARAGAALGVLAASCGLIPEIAHAEDDYNRWNTGLIDAMETERDFGHPLARLQAEEPESYVADPIFLDSDAEVSNAYGRVTRFENGEMDVVWSGDPELEWKSAPADGTRVISQEKRIDAILTDEAKRARTSLSKAWTIWIPLRDRVRPFHYMAGGDRRTSTGHYLSFRFYLDIDPLATEERIRREFRFKLMKAMQSVSDVPLTVDERPRLARR